MFDESPTLVPLLVALVSTSTLLGAPDEGNNAGDSSP